MKHRHSLARTIGHYVFVAIASCGLLLVNVRAQTALPKLDEYGRWTNGISEPWRFNSKEYSEAQADKAREKWEFIGSANDTDRSQWDGDYQTGDLHGAYLRLSDKHGFVLMSVFSCEANVTGVDYGRASVSSDVVELFSELPAKSHSAGDSHSHSYRVSHARYVPVKWGPDRYLVPEHQIASFAEYLGGVGKFSGGGGESEALDYYQNSTGYSVDLFTTAPVFPPAYEKFRRMPIVGKVVSVGRSFVRLDPKDEWWNRLLVPVTINVGRIEGVTSGMRLYLLGSEANETVEITRVGSHSSKGFINRVTRKNPGVRVNEWDDGAPIKQAPIEVGSRLTSSLHQALSVRKP